MTRNEDWSLNMSAGPIFEQISKSVHQMLARGALRPAEKLPSARALATTLSVNPNTIIHAYQQLEQQGLVETRRGLGTFVREDAPVLQMKQALLREAAVVYAESTRQLGISMDEAFGALREAWDAG
jgi:GntR family transcriptional regulator